MKLSRRNLSQMEKKLNQQIIAYKLFLTLISILTLQESLQQRQIIQKPMQRNKSTHSHTHEPKPPTHPFIDKPKNNKSKLKNTIQLTNSNTLINNNNINSNKQQQQTLSPIVPKIQQFVLGNGKDDKENGDTMSTIVRIMVAAAEPRQKQILNSLLTLVQKQKKLLSQAQTPSPQLHPLLSHLHAQQSHLLTQLKIQASKRKLHNLDKHDLKQDILNLNSYVMRRSKKEAHMMREQGIDLLGEIYGKFDEQAKIIGKVLGKEKEKGRKGMAMGGADALIQLNENNGSRISNMSNGSGQISGGSSVLRSKTFQQLPINTQYENSNSDKEQIVISSSKMSELSEKQKQKQKQKPRTSDLMQKILKLQKQNLRLLKQISKIEQQFQCVVQQKLILEQRLERVKIRYRGKQNFMTNCMNNIKNQLNQQRDQHEMVKEGVIGMLTEFGRYFWDNAELIVQTVKESESEIGKERSCEEQGQQQGGIGVVGDGVKKSIQSEDSIFQKYQALLTQKQLQINSLLKTISTQKKTLTFLTQQNSTLTLQLQSSATSLQALQALQSAHNTLLQKHQQLLLHFQEQQKNGKMERNRMVEEIAKVEDILRTEKKRAEESIREMSKEIKWSMEERDRKEADSGMLAAEVQELRAREAFLAQRVEQLKKQIIKLKEQKQLLSKSLKSQQTLSQNLQQEQITQNQLNTQLQQKNQIQTQNKIKQLTQYYNLLLDDKIQKIKVLELELERQKMKMEDFLAVVRKEEEKQRQFNSNDVIMKVQEIKPMLIFSSQNVNFSYCPIPNTNETVIQNLLQQIYPLLYKNKNFKELHNNPHQSPSQKITTLKNILSELLPPQSDPPNPHQTAAKDLQQPCGPTGTNEELAKCDLNEFEALSPEEEVGVGEEGSPFLVEMEPFTFGDVLGEQYFSLQAVINQQVLVPEVEALRNELAESFKRNEKLSQELKLYQQKDMDKIFDF